MGELNNKQQTLEKIIEIVVSCCRTEVSDGAYSVSYEDVLGKSKKENACMTRTILVNQLLWAGFTVSTVADILKRTPHAVRHIQRQHEGYVASSRAYRIALSEATIRCRDIEVRGL